MNYWNLLGIEPTDDIRLIKRAYADKLKIFHPEEDPDEFSKLQEAYRQALSQAETAVVREAYGEPFRQLSWQQLRQARWADAPPSPREPAAGRFMELLTSLCADAARRSDPGEWQRLLKGEEWPLSLAPELHDEVLRLLKEQLPLPYEAWTGCNELFAWIEPDKLDELFDNDELIAMLEMLEYGGNWLSSRVRGDVLLGVRVCDALLSRGRQYTAMRNTEKAIACYDRIVALFGEVDAFRYKVVQAAADRLLCVKKLGDADREGEAREELWRIMCRAELRPGSDWREARRSVAEDWLSYILGMRDAEADPAEIISLCDELLALFDAAENPAILARVLFNKGVCYHLLGDDERQRAAYDELLRRFESTEYPDVQLYVAEALYNQGCIGERQGDEQGAIEFYTRVIDRFLGSIMQGLGSKEQDIAEVVVDAMGNLSALYVSLGRMEEAIALSEQAIERFGKSGHTEIRATVSSIMVNQGRIYAGLEKTEQALAAYNQVIDKFLKSKHETIRLNVAWALRNKALCCAELDRLEEAIAAGSQVAEQFENSKDGQILWVVSLALGRMATHYEELERWEEAIAACDRLINKFAGTDGLPTAPPSPDDEEEDILLEVARAMCNKSLYCDKAKQPEAGIAVGNLAIEWFIESDNEQIRKLVILTMERLAGHYIALSQWQEAIAVCKLAESWFGDSDNEEIRASLADIWLRQGDCYYEVGWYKDADAAYNKASKGHRRATTHYVKEAWRMVKEGWRSLW
ncbi:heat shock protein DnaJ domain protein [Pelosinus fermentans JBW45]|uniref:Heat shock protein DnaJ domain protein n=2 Tax=Pelosinus TaxID=365348 RepID=I8U4S4_9FIRM|nr:heat shock protein DnaJ domain protein [Pelosinus fermentans JBW45]